MTATASIERDFKRKIRTQLDLQPEGIDRYLVSTPFTFGDGDGLPIVLKREGSHWVLTDEGHTLMHLTYELDEREIRTGERKAIIDRTLTAFSVENRGGELALRIPNAKYGDALYNFIQALLAIDHVRYLSEERARSTFLDDFRNFMESRVPEGRREFQWHDPVRDPEGIYKVDCKLNGTPGVAPLFVFALPTDERVQFATISLYEIETWKVPFQSVGIFEDVAKITHRQLTAFMNVCRRSYGNLAGAQERLAKEFPQLVPAAAE